MKNIRKTGLLVLFLLSVNLAKAQYGTIQGVLTDSENGEALIGSNVFIESTTFGTATDLEGNFKIERIVPGTYQLNITSLGYKAEVIQNVVVKENQITIIIFCKQRTEYANKIFAHTCIGIHENGACCFINFSYGFQ